MKIAVDVMGGDYAPREIIKGIKLSLGDFPEVSCFSLVGDTNQITQILKEENLSRMGSRLEIVHAADVVVMSDPSSIAIRGKKKSSITCAISLMRDKKVDAVVSAGHTGAAVTASVVINRMLPGIDRPGIAGIFPTEKGSFIMLDVGANVDCKPIHLAQYAIMGEVYSRVVFNVKKPSVGILSIGGEDGKGNELTKEAYRILHKMPINFLGNVEGHDLFSNRVNVVICDGFVGNVVLKCCEHLAKTISGILKKNLRKSPVRMAGALLSKNAFKELKEMIDHEEYGGAPLLGIDGTCIIAHGSSSAKAICNAIKVAKNMVRHRCNGQITKKIAKIDWKELLTEVN